MRPRGWANLCRTYGAPTNLIITATHFPTLAGWANVLRTSLPNPRGLGYVFRASGAHNAKEA